MICMQRTLLGLLLAGTLSAAEPASAVPKGMVKIGDSRASAQSRFPGVAGSGALDDAAVMATVRSSGGLILNGVPTPRGVNSVVVTRGDVVQTSGSSAIATYADRQSVNLSPATSYESQSGRLIPTLTNTKPTKLGLFALPPVSIIKH